MVIGNKIPEIGSIVKTTFLSNSVEKLSTLDIAVCADQILIFRLDIHGSEIVDLNTRDLLFTHWFSPQVAGKSVSPKLFKN